MAPQPLPLVLDRGSPVPLYHQLAEQLAAAVRTGVLLPGDGLENELAMMDRLDVSRATVRRAIQQLVTQGLLVRRRGRGTTVADRLVHRKVELTSLYDDLVGAGREPRTEVLQHRRGADTEGAAGLGLVDDDEALLYLERVRYADDEPIALLRNWLPPALADIDATALEGDGLYAVLRARGVRPQVAHQTISARPPSARERRLLGIGRGQPVLTMTRLALAADGTPIEYGSHCYPAAAYNITVMIDER